MAGIRSGYGLRLAAFVSRGVRWRTGHSEGLGGEHQPTADTAGQSNGRDGNDRDEAEPDVPEDVEAAPPPAAERVTPPSSPAPPAGAAPLAAREAAVGAYCLELCGAGRMRVAADEVIASPRLSAPPASVPEHELLRVTRATASGFAPAVLQPGVTGVSIQAVEHECGFTIPRLARRDNGELDRYSNAALAAHLASCLVCRAAEARHDRAERAFNAVLGVALAPPPAVPEPPAPVDLGPPPPVVPEEPPLLGRWGVLIATLIAGAVGIVVIALLWSNG